MTNQIPLHLAMWSGPRNISTAMMRSWGNRSDTFVCDEPFYAFYLKATGLPHPIADEIIAAGEPDWRKVTQWLTGPIPDGKTIFYQKQMTHHLLPEIEEDWLGKVTHGFLIRDPREVMTSYIRKNGEPNVEDLGFVQQARIFDWVRAHTGTTPPVLDAKEILDDSRGQLGALCDALGVDFQESMLEWEPGIRPTDGVWAKHWYPEVETSTTFRPYRAKDDEVPPHLSEVYEACLASYAHLYEHRLR